MGASSSTSNRILPISQENLEANVKKPKRQNSALSIATNNFSDDGKHLGFLSSPLSSRTLFSSPTSLSRPDSADDISPKQTPLVPPLNVKDLVNLTETPNKPMTFKPPFLIDNRTVEFKPLSPSQSGMFPENHGMSSSNEIMLTSEHLRSPSRQCHVVPTGPCCETPGWSPKKSTKRTNKKYYCRLCCADFADEDDFFEHVQFSGRHHENVLKHHANSFPGIADCI